MPLFKRKRRRARDPVDHNRLEVAGEELRRVRRQETARGEVVIRKAREEGRREGMIEDALGTELTVETKAGYGVPVSLRSLLKAMGARSLMFEEKSGKPASWGDDIPDYKESETITVYGRRFLNRYQLRINRRKGSNEAMVRFEVESPFGRSGLCTFSASGDAIHLSKEQAGKTFDALAGLVEAKNILADGQSHERVAKQSQETTPGVTETFQTISLTPELARVRRSRDISIVPKR